MVLSDFTGVGVGFGNAPIRNCFLLLILIGIVI